MMPPLVLTLPPCAIIKSPLPATPTAMGLEPVSHFAPAPVTITEACAPASRARLPAPPASVTPGPMASVPFKTLVLPA